MVLDIPVLLLYELTPVLEESILPTCYLHVVFVLYNNVALLPQTVTVLKLALPPFQAPNACF